VAVASAGPYASLQLTPDREPCQHPTTQFLQAGCPSCHPTNSVKALKAKIRLKYLLNTRSKDSGVGIDNANDEKSSISSKIKRH